MPAYPGITDRLLHELNEGTANPSDIERYFSSDPALSAKALRMVNSDYYGLSAKVDSLSQAVLILGMQQIRNLVLSVQGQARSLAYEAREPHAQLWSHCFATATGAQLILQQKRFGSTEAEFGFLCGLLHDLGKLFLLSRFPSDYATLLDEARAQESTVGQLETERFGTTSAEAGRNLSKNWRFPENLSSAIGLDATKLDGATDPVLLAVHIADCLTQDPFEVEEAPRAINPNAFVWLNWGESELEWLCCEMQKRVQASARFLADFSNTA